MQVLLAGAWHLGSVIGACLAEAGNKVHLWDQTPSVALSWAKGEPPLEEPGLIELAQRNWQKNLFWVSNLGDVPTPDWIVVSYDTPVDESDEIDLSEVENGLHAILAVPIRENTHFFVTAQVPVGTTRRFKQEILLKHPQWTGHIVYQPENLRLGEAIRSFVAPDRMVLGLDVKSHQADKLVKEFRRLLGNENTPMTVMSLESAEMVKHALNSFLGTCIVFANELSTICEKTGANAWDVVSSLKQDSRVGPKAYLRPSLGFSGGTLARDVKTLSKLSETKENFFYYLYEINRTRNEWILSHLDNLIPSEGKKRVVLLGVTYKPFTSTVRRSPALEIGSLLRAKNIDCVAIDPQADLDELNEVERDRLPFEMSRNVEKAFKDADAAIVVTEGPQFIDFNWAHLHSQMKSPIVIDCKKLLDPTKMQGYTHIIPGQVL